MSESLRFRNLFLVDLVQRDAGFSGEVVGDNVSGPVFNMYDDTYTGKNAAGVELVQPALV